MIEIIGVAAEGGNPKPYEVVIWADPDAPESLTEQAHFSCRLVVDGLNAVVAEKDDLIAADSLQRRRFAGDSVLFEPDPNEERKLRGIIDRTEEDRHAFALLANRVNYDAFGGWESGLDRPMNLCYVGQTRLPLLVAGIMKGAQIIAAQRGLRGDAATEFYQSHIKHTVLTPGTVAVYKEKFSPYLTDDLF